MAGNRLSDGGKLLRGSGSSETSSRSAGTSDHLICGVVYGGVDMGR